MTATVRKLLAFAIAFLCLLHLLRIDRKAANKAKKPDARKRTMSQGRRWWLGAAVTASIVVVAGGWLVGEGLDSDILDDDRRLLDEPRTEVAAPTRPQGGSSLTAAPIFYVDSLSGDDDNDGLTPSTAWRSLERVNRAELTPASQVLFRRGGQWIGSLSIAASGSETEPIVIGAYDTGPKPLISGSLTCVELTGSYLRLEDLDIGPCRWAGVSVTGSNVTVTDNRIHNNAVGVYLTRTAQDNRVLDNEIVDNNKPSETNEGSGAFGILIHGDQNEIAFNRIVGSDMASSQFGRDGSAVEIFGGRSNFIHHNEALANHSFSELGNERSQDNLFAFNVVVSSLDEARFLVTRGPGSRYGPINGTAVLHNSVYLSGRGSQGFVCHAGCNEQILSIKNNIIYATTSVGFSDASLDEDNNIYFGGEIVFSMGPNSEFTDPMFVAPEDGDLRLRSGSPAIDSAAAVVLEGLPTAVVAVDGDSDGKAVQDIGAFEFVPTEATR